MQRGSQMIKQILKNNGITLIKFSEELNISRPTLDNYMKAFENGDEIGNDLFQNIFSFLFSNATITEAEFSSKFDYIKKYYGLGSQIPDEGTANATEVAFSDDEIALREDAALFSNFKEYISGKKKLDDLTDKEKKYFSMLFRVEKELSINDYNYSKTDFDEFVDCCNQHYDSEHPEDFISEIVKNKINKIMKDNKGLKIDQILLKLKDEL